MKEFAVIIGADLVPTISNYDEFKKGEVNCLLGEELVNVLKEADYRIVNLEIPLTDVLDPINKSGPVLYAPSSTIKAYKSMNINLVTLANNHCMDENNVGLQSSIRQLKNNGIAYLGAGDNLQEAKKPYIITTESGFRIGIYACAEHEFTIAEQNKPGANPYNPLESFDDVYALKNNCDYLIVLYHGGKEHYRYPSPNLQRVCHKFVDKGADFVITQHSHCIGCKEEYGNGTIIYGQGNFIFDNSKSEYWKTSILVKIVISDKITNITYIPLMKHGSGVRLAKDLEANKILDDFYKRSEEIKTNGFVEKKYSEFCDSLVNSYIPSVVKRNIFFRVLNKLTHYKLQEKYPYKFRKSSLLAIQNDLQCEAHRELLITALKNKIEKQL